MPRTVDLTSPGALNPLGIRAPLGASPLAVRLPPCRSVAPRGRATDGIATFRRSGEARTRGRWRLMPVYASLASVIALKPPRRNQDLRNSISLVGRVSAKNGYLISHQIFLWAFIWA